MNESLSRRDFSRLASAAFGGVVAGAMLAGCEPSTKTPAGPVTAKDQGAKGAKPMAAGNKHGCRGLNECKGQGGDGKNTCAGQGTCATVAEHSCGGQNDCKNLGGCGTSPGSNECKGKGGCAVPMTHGDAWDRARVAFEARMKEAKKSVGAPPAK